MLLQCCIFNNTAMQQNLNIATQHWCSFRNIAIQRGVPRTSLLQVLMLFEDVVLIEKMFCISYHFVKEIRARFRRYGRSCYHRVGICCGGLGSTTTKRES